MCWTYICIASCQLNLVEEQKWAKSTTEGAPERDEEALHPIHIHAQSDESGYRIIEIPSAVRLIKQAEKEFFSSDFIPQPTNITSAYLIFMSSKSPSVLLFGVGSVGAIYLLQLQRAGCSVTAVCRSNYEAVTRNGFCLTSPGLGSVTYRPDHTVRSVAECPSDTVYDYILVTAKSFPDSRPSLADLLRPALEGRPTTAIVLAQNGIGIESDIAEEFPYNPVLSAVIYLPVIQTSPGSIHHAETLNLFEVGTFPADAPPSHKACATELANLMIQGGGQANVYEDIQIARWSKLLLNASWNPVCALSLRTDGDFLCSSSPFAHDLVWGIMMEVVSLAKKMGIPEVDEKAAEARLAIAKRRAEEGTGREMSMLQDVRQGRPFEVEAIVGNTVRLGRTMGIPMPRLETVYALAKGRYDALAAEIK